MRRPEVGRSCRPTSRPEKGLLGLRAHMEVFANLRPAKLFARAGRRQPAQARARQAASFDFVVVRELVGGLYFGKPRFIQGERGERVGANTMTYTEAEIARIGRVAFETARRRNKKLTSVDKANVLEVMALWREVMTELGKEYPDVEARAPVRRQLRDAADPAPDRLRRARDREHVRRHPVGPRGGGDRLDRPVAVGGDRREAARCTSRCTARRPTSPARARPTRSRRS